MTEFTDEELHEILLSGDLEGLEDDERKQVAQRAYSKSADAIWARTKNLGLPEGAGVTQDIYACLSTGFLDRAEQKLKALEARRSSELDKKADEYIASGGEVGFNPQRQGSGGQPQRRAIYTGILRWTKQ